VIRRMVCLILLCTIAVAFDDSSEPSLTIYNQNFAVVRQELPLELKSEANSVRVTDITMHLEPDSKAQPNIVGFPITASTPFSPSREQVVHVTFAIHDVADRHYGIHIQGGEVTEHD